MKGDSSVALSSTPPRFIMIHDVRSCYMCKICEAAYFELRATYDKLCENEKLKEYNKIVVEKGLTHALNFPRNYKIEWIKVVLRKIHDMKLLLENELVKITK